MHEVYLFPGLGADKRMFEKFALSGVEIKVVEYEEPIQRESLKEYCARLSKNISCNANTIFIGASFGGIVAQQIAEEIHPQKIIIISSVRSTKEFPWYFFIAKWFPLYQWMSEKRLKRLAKGLSWLFTTKNEVEKKYFTAMLNSANGKFLKWAIKNVLNWNQSTEGKNVIQIHGDCDRVFPLGHIVHPNYVVRGGQHFLMFRKAEELNVLLNKILVE